MLTIIVNGHFNMNATWNSLQKLATISGTNNEQHKRSATDRYLGSDHSE